MQQADTPAKRAYLVRLACGDGFKTPEPMAAFAVRLTRRKRGAWDSAKVSRVESGDRKLTLDDVATYAEVDPLKRGRSWIAFGDPTDAMDAIVNPALDRRLTDEEIARARKQVAADRASKSGADRKKGNGGRRA